MAIAAYPKSSRMSLGRVPRPSGSVAHVRKSHPPIAQAPSYSPECVEGGFAEVREDHSFEVCAAAPLCNTISSLLSRPPLTPLEEQRTGFSIRIGPLLWRRAFLM